MSESKLILIDVDEVGFAILICIDYVKNSEDDAREFFNSLYAILSGMGYHFDNRVFYKIAKREQIEHDVSLAISQLEVLKSISDSSKYFKSIHLVPLSQFYDITSRVVQKPQLV